MTYIEARGREAKSITYHQLDGEKERNRAAERTQWVQHLRLSLIGVNHA